MMEHGYVRVCAAVPETKVAGVADNFRSVVGILSEEEVRACDLVVFPELCLTGYTCGDLFKQENLIRSAEQHLALLRKQTEDLVAAVVVGLPVEVNGKMFNCAAVLQSGHLLGVVPKSYLPGYKEYYEPRWFTPGDHRDQDEVVLGGETVPFGTDLLFRSGEYAAFTLGIEICEDLWAPIPPSSSAALAGGTVIANPSASNALVGKQEYRSELVRQQSARTLSAYVYTSAGWGESSTDLVFCGQTAVAENGGVLRDTVNFSKGPLWSIADIDCGLLANERLHNGTFSQGGRIEREKYGNENGHRNAFRFVPLRPFEQHTFQTKDLRRDIDPWPFVPSGKERLNTRCEEIFSIQTSALAKRLEHTGAENVVLGLSGGLDSTLALLVTEKAFARLGLSKSGIHCFTLPGFGTSEKTRQNVQQLCEAMGLELKEVDITEASRVQLRDLQHSEDARDTVFENVQARQRTQFLMNMANKVGGLVVGTGDMSELALGWCTYNADHMSMYGVNAGIPKTLVRFVITHVAETWAEAGVADALRAVLETPITPELLPPDEGGEIIQKTEEVIGPYELHDFFLYHVVRRGFPPEKTYALTCVAFGDRYGQDEIAKWLEVFYRRFFSQQFKRSCMPDGPQVGSVALSPRGNWRMPSDAVPEEWLRRLHAVSGQRPAEETDAIN